MLRISSPCLVNLLGYEKAKEAILKEVERGNPPIAEIRNGKGILELKYFKL